jgi:hypothetical protein
MIFYLCIYLYVYISIIYANFFIHKCLHFYMIVYKQLFIQTQKDTSSNFQLPRMECVGHYWTPAKIKKRKEELSTILRNENVGDNMISIVLRRFGMLFSTSHLFICCFEVILYLNCYGWSVWIQIFVTCCNSIK